MKATDFQRLSRLVVILLEFEPVFGQYYEYSSYRTAYTIGSVIGSIVLVIMFVGCCCMIVRKQRNERMTATNAMGQPIPIQQYTIAYAIPGQQYLGQDVQTFQGQPGQAYPVLPTDATIGPSSSSPPDPVKGQVGQAYPGQAYAPALPTGTTIGASSSTPPDPVKGGEPPPY